MVLHARPYQLEKPSSFTPTVKMSYRINLYEIVGRPEIFGISVVVSDHDYDKQPDWVLCRGNQGFLG